MDHETIDALRERNHSWRLLRADTAPLVLSFLGRHFVDENHGRTASAELAALLDEELYALNAGLETPRYPKAPIEYLNDWAQPDRGWLNSTYPEGSDEVHFNATAALDRAYQWVRGLQTRTFVGTESRLQTLVGLLREIVQGSEADPEVRLADLWRRREQLDAEIAAAEAGQFTVLDPTALRDRYQQFSGTARELLSDFREVEENFRALDRAARQRIATWEGSKGELLADLVGSRANISTSDQGRSFQAFYDLLLSEARQDELSELLAQVQSIGAVQADRRLRTIHHDWSEAAERAQYTVRQLSEQLRRFLDDQVWVENRRVVELIREVESAALEVRDSPPGDVTIEIDAPGFEIVLPLERPLYDASPAAHVDSLIDPGPDEEPDVEALFAQRFVDAGRLAGNIREVVPAHSSALLSDIVSVYPIEQGAAEIVGYLALADGDLEVEIDESDETLVDYTDQRGQPRHARLPKVTVSRR